jgi:hypothetical protein
MSAEERNPYAPPKAIEPAPAAPVDGWTTCPRCKSADVRRPTFTWWGGALGPKLFNHAVCGGCGFGFNWKTGESNATKVTIYTVVGIVLGIAAGLAWVATR